MGEEEVTGGAREQAPLSREAVFDALAACYDPCCRDRQISVVDMGLIERVAIAGRDVKIEMVLTSGWCPFAARLLDMVHERVGELPGVERVEADIIWRTAWTPERMSAEAREKLRLPLERLLPLREARLKGGSA
jgi:metal-sulfur cluster biosynthetic enzyme